MAILDAMQKAAQRLVGYKPATFFASGQDQGIEPDLCDLINEVARDVVASNDWQGLTKVAYFTGNGTTEEFAKPTDYERQLVRTDIQDPNNWVFGYYHCTDINEFLWRKNRGLGPWPGIWILYGDQFHFWPAPGDQQLAQWPYISNAYGNRASDGAAISEFTRDDDTFKLPERLLTLGMIWRWRENKKMDFTGDQEAFMKAISEYSAKDKGSTIIRSRSSRINGNFHYAWPWELG